MSAITNIDSTHISIRVHPQNSSNRELNQAVSQDTPMHVRVMRADLEIEGFRPPARYILTYSYKVVVWH